MSQRPYPPYPQPPAAPLQHNGSPRTGTYPQSPYPQNPHFQGHRPQTEYGKGVTTNGPPQYSSSAPSNIALPNQVFSSPYYGSQSNGGPPNHNFSPASPYLAHPSPAPYTSQYDHNSSSTPATPHQDASQLRAGTMGPPSRPNDKPTDINDLGDVLVGSGVDLREEEAAMFKFNSSDRQQPNGVANGAPYPFSRDNHYSPNVPGDRQGFYGAGFYNQPAATYKSTEATAEANKQQKIRENAEIRQYHLNNPFLLAGSVRKKMLAEVTKSHVKFDDSLLWLPKNPPDPPQKRTFFGPDGHSVERRIYNQVILQHESTLVEILSLLSLATQERMRMLVEDAATLARGRRAGALCLEEDVPAASPQLTTGGNPLKRKSFRIYQLSFLLTYGSYSEMNELPNTTETLSISPVAQALQQTIKEDTLEEEKRITRRNDRRAKKAAAEGQALEVAGIPSASGDVAPNIDIKKVAKKGKAADNVSQAQQLNALNNTTQMALGGKKMPSWMSGASRGPSNPYLARPNANLKKEPSLNNAGAGNSVGKNSPFGGFKEDGEEGKGIQLRDLILVLEQNVKGMEKRGLQRAYGMRHTSNPRPEFIDLAGWREIARKSNHIFKRYNIQPLSFDEPFVSAMSHARIEELSDSDSDPPEDDLDDFAESDIIRSVNQNQSPQPSSFNQRGQLSSKTAPHAPAIPTPQSQATPSPFSPSEFLRPQAPQQQQSAYNTTTQPPPEYKTYQCLYPIYFDANKTRQEGRRVTIENAVPNPLAREIVDAVQSLGLKTVFEPGKMHPKDWSNPGRVRVGLKDAGGGRSRIKNKHHLYTLVAAHLKENPTTTSSPLRLRVQGMPLSDSPPPPPSVPKGWKLNTILPLHSPALSGGGVSENILKDMMQEMQGAGGAAGGNPMAEMMGSMGGGAADAAAAGSGGGETKQGKRKREGKKK